jgi:hypothetical protein
MAGIPQALLLIESPIMLPFLSRGCLSVLIVLESLSPALAWEWYVVEEHCGCEADWGCCESEVVMESDSCGCGADNFVVDECGCDSESAAIDSTMDSTEITEPTPATAPPKPSQSNKASAPEPAAPRVETPQPTLDPTHQLPPAPINVPTTPPAAESETNELFPGPAVEPAVTAETEPETVTPTNPAPAEVVPPTTPTTKPTPPSDDAGSLFEEPAAESLPAGEPAGTQPAPTGEATRSEPSSIDDDVFGESVPPAEEESVEVESIETETPKSTATPESKDTEQPAADPLDDLFGPSSAIEQPKHNLVAAPRGIGDGLANSGFRQWSNRDNDFHWQGRLFRLTSAGVFVAQPNGEFVAIAFSQLSDDDLAFVRSEVEAQRALLAEQEADSQIVSRGVR